jgi:hypothetical protein
MDLYFWKWSISEPYYKSARREVNLEKEQEREVSEYDTQLNAINQSLSDNLDPSNNVREELDNRVADRELVQQRGSNPFLTQQSSYVNDIVVRDMFLKPINTTQGRTKNKDDES